MDEPHEDKMDRSGEDKIAFISRRAELVARQLGVTDNDLRAYEPASSKGFAVSEVRDIRKELNRG